MSKVDHDSAYYLYMREQWVMDFLFAIDVGVFNERDPAVMVMMESLRATYDLQQQVTNLQEQVDELSKTVVSLRNS